MDEMLKFALTAQYQTFNGIRKILKRYRFVFTKEEIKAISSSTKPIPEVLPGDSARAKAVVSYYEDVQRIILNGLKIVDGKVEVVADKLRSSCGS